MRLYNATMKINRLEMLKANIGLELIAGHQDLEKFMGGILKGRTEEELKRQAGILGKTIKNNAQLANAIVNGSFHNATFSDRIWLYQDLMKADLAKLLQSGMIQGKNARVLARELKNKFQVGTFNAERLMRTELARVQTDAQKQSFEHNGFSKYTFIVNGGCCDICAELDGKHFKVSKMMPGLNAPPMHPHCRCSTAAYEDSKEYENWLDHLDKGGTTEEWNKVKTKHKMASSGKNQNKWDDAIARTVTKAEKQELIEYAKEKGVNIVDLSKFDGDPSLLKAEINTLSKLNAEYPTGKKKITITVSDTLDDADFASTTNNTITFNAKALRNREVTERNIRLTKGEFASKCAEDIAAHEFGHIISVKKGNKGIEISQQAYYNIYGKNMEMDEIIVFLNNEVSQYAIEYNEKLDGIEHKSNARRYQEIIPEILAKHNSNANAFTNEFVKLLKEV